MSILTLPDEILYHLLTFVEDTDMQTLALVNKQLRCITMDGPLRRHILLKRTPARLQSSLSDRPSRDTLAKQNILRGIHIRQHIQDGQYIGGPTAVRSYQISCRLERQMVSIRIAKKLKTRPDWTELVDRGLIPEEMFMKEEELETKQKWKMYQQRNQQHRRSSSNSSNSSKSRDKALGAKPADGREPQELSIPQQQQQFESQRQPLTFEPTPSSPSPSSSSSTAYSRSRPRRQRKSISMVLVPKIELLRKALDRDRLSRLFQKRPSPTELNQSSKTATVLHAYHLKAYSTTSPALVPLTAQLNFLLKGERLGQWLYRRPSLAVMLNERHLLKTEVRTAWMICPGVSKKVRFYEGLIQAWREQ
ncbi:hypothetical protein EDD11_002850 [Mortierella claussenii]|nr:hypothetical protein EDD11_002850 [Mortierella claussenii]